MKDRVKELRKALKLTQNEFGSKIGVTRDAVAAYERGVSIKEPIIKLMCNVFNVNYAWLVEGIGEMFNEVGNDDIEYLVKTFGLDEMETKLVMEFLTLDKDDRAAIIRYLDKVYGKK